MIGAAQNVETLIGRFTTIIKDVFVNYVIFEPVCILIDFLLILLL